MTTTPDDAAADGFLSRWSRRKALVRQGAAVPEPPPATVVTAPPAAGAPAVVARADGAPPAAVDPPARAGAAHHPHDSTATPPVDPLPTIEDARALAPGADVRRFVAPGVQPEVRNAALKRLFADPHFNVMDGLDTYIDDYGRPDPLPAGMLRQMAQAAALGLFSDDDEDDETTRAAARTDPTPGAAPHAATAPAATAAIAPGNTPATEPLPAPDEDPDLRLQPHDATGPGRTAPGAGPHAGRQR